MTITEFTGYGAACLTSASFLPQAIKVIKTRNTDGLSLIMYAMFTLGVAFWVIYGVLLAAWPVIIANVVTLILAVIILSMIIINQRKP